MPKLENANENYYHGRLIDKETDSIVYFDDTHEYRAKEDDLKGVSVTTMIHEYTNPFDSAFWSSYKALEALCEPEIFEIIKPKLLQTKRFNKSIIDKLDIDLDEFNNKKQEILESYALENKKSCEYGTKVHADIENALYGRDPGTLKKFGLGGKLQVFKGKYTLDLGTGIYPEFMLSYRDGDFLLCGQIDLLAVDGNDIIILDHKGLDINTPIPTKDGFKLMKDIVVGDILFDKDGSQVKVINKSKTHYNPCYKIKFDNGEEIIADHEHRWIINFRHQSRKGQVWKEKIMTTEELKTWIETKSRHVYNIPKILNTEPIQCEERPLPIDPYILGAWLGDGSAQSGVITQAKDSPLWNEIQKRGYKVGDNLIHSKDRQGTESRTIFNLRGKLSELDLLNNKHVPMLYLRASYEQRLDLLRGLMDTDGSYNKIRHRYIMATSYKWQMEGLVQLLGTFGIKSTVFDVIKKCNGKEFPGWDICFTTDLFNPFLIRNQNIDLQIKKDNHSYRTITSIEKVDTIPTQCIEVDSPSHTYLFGYQMIPTHNTNKKVEFKSFYDKYKKSQTMMKYPLNTIQDCNGQHYTLQLSTYAWMIQQLNPKYNILRLTIHWIDHDGKESFIEVPYMKDEVEKMLKDYKKKLKIQRALDRDKPYII